MTTTVKMRHASQAMQRAAFNKIWPRLERAVAEWVPSLFQWQAQQKLRSEGFLHELWETIDEALDAAETVEANEAANAAAVQSDKPA